MFSGVLIDWYGEKKRDLPWRKTTDPYRIWLSEIMLQQTRVNQGLPYYVKFIQNFPTVFDLAKAEEKKVLKLWQGLGYYTRARNLHYTARYVAEKHNGKFPKTYKGLLKLKGVGDYTASAIASICYQEPVAVLDGNVFRVLSRYFGTEIPIDSTEGKKWFKKLAEKSLDKNRPALHNQAIMEFGAVQCMPKNPQCNKCPLASDCKAFQNGWVEKLPVTTKKTKTRTRHLNYLVFVSEENTTILLKRERKGIWRNLYEFPLIESETFTEAHIKENGFSTLNEPPELYNPKPIKHLLSHQKLLVKFWVLRCKKLPERKFENGEIIVDFSKIPEFPVPVVLGKFIERFWEKED